MFYFARHGRTELNDRNCFQGFADAPLTDIGQAQARRLGELAKGWGMTNIVVSPRGRAIATAKIVIETIGQSLSMVIDEQWREMCYGDWEAKTETDIIGQPKYEEWQAYHFDFTYPGSYQAQPGDGYAQRYAALVPVFEFLKAQAVSAAPTLFITHYTPLRFLRKYFEQWSDEQAMAYEHPHDVVLRLAINDGQSQIKEISLD